MVVYVSVSWRRSHDTDHQANRLGRGLRNGHVHLRDRRERPEAGRRRIIEGPKLLTCGPAPDAFPAGAKMAVERGDPTKSGEFTVRLSFPAGYKN